MYVVSSNLISSLSPLKWSNTLKQLFECVCPFCRIKAIKNGVTWNCQRKTFFFLFLRINFLRKIKLNLQHFLINNFLWVSPFNKP